MRLCKYDGAGNALAAGELAATGFASRRVLLRCPQAARRPHPPRAGRDATRRTCPPAQGRPSGASPRHMPTQEPPKTRGSRGDLHTRPPDPGPAVSLYGRRVPRPSLGKGFIPPSLKDPAFSIPSLTPNHDSCGVCRDWYLEASKPASPVLCANPGPEPTGHGPRRLYLRMSCPPDPSWAPRSLLDPSLGRICLGPTHCQTMSCECLPCCCWCLGTGKGHRG